MKTQEKLDLEINKFIKEYGEIFDKYEKHKVSSVLLFKDFTRRLCHWKKELDIPFKFNINPNNINLLLDVNPNLASEMMSVEDFISYLEENHAVKFPRNREKNYLFVYLFIGKSLKIEKSLKSIPI